jgi:hypothetical protein
MTSSHDLQPKQQNLMITTNGPSENVNDSSLKQIISFVFRNCNKIALSLYSTGLFRTIVKFAPKERGK